MPIEESEAPLADWVTLPPVAESVRDARRFVAAGLGDAHCSETTIGDAVLLVSELATNAVLHARTSFRVGVARQRDIVTIEVADGAQLRPSMREPDANSGRGLHIVDAIAADWGIRDDPEGKTVFFHLPC